MLTLRDLRERLANISGRGYTAYKDIAGSYQCGSYVLHIDHVQGDPYAEPSRLRLAMGWKATGYDPSLCPDKDSRVAFADFLARKAHKVAKSLSRHAGTGTSGMISVDAGGQEMLPRTAVHIDDRGIELRLAVGLPAEGRRVLGREAERLLIDNMQLLAKQALSKQGSDEPWLSRWIQTYLDQEEIRKQMKQKGLIAWIGNGSILPRRSGVDDRPMDKDKAVPFVSPPALEVDMDTRYHGALKGAGIREGVTLIVGGGYHGKTTLLKALERGVYNHIPGDGREWALCDRAAVKIRAEDGRRVEKVNITPFIDNLPGGQRTDQFESDNASGSTSQAANIVEALEMGCRVLLLDEDTSATNFMIRDVRMQMLVKKEHEPITPFIDRVRQLYVEKGVSSVIVIGGAGDYFDVADEVIKMVQYTPEVVTAEARRIAREIPTRRIAEVPSSLSLGEPRIIDRECLDPYRRNKIKVQAKGRDTIIFGDEVIDLGAVEQLVDVSQTRAIAEIILYCHRYAQKDFRLSEMLEKVYRDIEEYGLDKVSRYYGQHPGDLALPRIFETAAAINRLRKLKVKGSL